MNWNDYVGKKVFIVDVNDKTYSGIVQEFIDAGHGILFISFIFKDYAEIERWQTLRISEIKRIKEEL